MPIEGKCKTTEEEKLLVFHQMNTHSPFMNCQKKVIHLLRLGKHVHREDDGANEFWRIKDNLQEHFLVIIGLTTRGRKSMARGGGSKNRYQYCTDSSGAILHLRPLQSQSGRSVVLPSGFFSSAFITSDVHLQSICTPSSIRDWCLEVKIWATDSILSACGSHGQKPQGSCYDRLE